jgi:hypothetical protein
LEKDRRRQFASFDLKVTLNCMQLLKYRTGSASRTRWDNGGNNLQKCKNAKTQECKCACNNVTESVKFQRDKAGKVPRYLR